LDDDTRRRRRARTAGRHQRFSGEPIDVGHRAVIVGSGDIRVDALEDANAPEISVPPSRMAGALFGSLPVAILYSLFVEYYVAGLTGAVKG
jgi:hypothetical protein